MPILIYGGKRIEISPIDAEWLKNLDMSHQLVKVILDGRELLVPRAIIMTILRKEEREKAKEKLQKHNRPRYELPIRKPIEECPPGRYCIPERRFRPPISIPVYKRIMRRNSKTLTIQRNTGHMLLLRV